MPCQSTLVSFGQVFLFSLHHDLTVPSHLIPFYDGNTIGDCSRVERFVLI